jgi:AraC-like DNA-binding protein
MPIVTTRPCSPALAPFVASLQYLDGRGPEVPTTLERVLPNARTHLLVNLHEDEFRTYRGQDCATVQRTHGAVLGGPASKSTVIDTREQRYLMMVNFKLGGAAPFFELPLSETRDQLVELDQLWGRDGGVLRERLLEARTPEAKFQSLEMVLLDHIMHPQEAGPAIRLAASAFERGLSVSDVAGRLGLLPKAFVRRFRERVGLTPKRFSRVRRLQRVVGSIVDSGAADWAALAAQHGYTDQAHLIHDFRELTGITPTWYRPRSAEEHNHVPVAASGG